MGTMLFGYHYEEGKNVGYNVYVKGFVFTNVSYKTKGGLIRQLMNDGYVRSDIKTERVRID